MIFRRMSTSFSTLASSNSCNLYWFLRRAVPHSGHAPDPRKNSLSTQLSHLNYQHNETRVKKLLFLQMFLVLQMYLGIIQWSSKLPFPCSFGCLNLWFENNINNILVNLFLSYMFLIIRSHRHSLRSLQFQCPQTLFP